MANAYLLTLFIVLFGFALILLDIVLIPGGFVGAGGGVLILVTLIYGFKHFGREFALNVSLFTVTISLILAWATFRFRLWTLLQHKGTAKKEAGFSSFTIDLKSLVGKEGIALTPLHPVGRIKIADKKYDAITQGDMIKAETKIVVANVSAAQLVVKEQVPDA